MTAMTSPLSKLSIEFVGSFPDPAHKLEPELPEFAFIGRSNVGKSSLLNALVAKKGLARVSSTPGKTQLLNVFRLPPFYLIDLPGYGFAQSSQAARREYRILLETLLKTRTSLSGIVWLLDVRHKISVDDEDFQTLLADAGRPVLTVLTKADKIVRGKQAATVAMRGREVGLSAEEIQLVSASTGQGISDLGEALLAAAAHERETV